MTRISNVLYSPQNTEIFDSCHSCDSCSKTKSMHTSVVKLCKKRKGTTFYYDYNYYICNKNG